MKNKTLTMVALFVVAAAVAAPAARAQEQGNQITGGACGSVYDSCGGDNYGHTFPGGIGVNGGNAHSDCEWCYEGAVVVSPLECHGACTSMIPAAEQKSYAALLSAGAKGDVDAILNLGHTIPDYVSYNRARSAVQIQSCDKTSVIATVGLRTPAQLRVASTLPHRNVQARWTLGPAAAGEQPKQ